MKSKQWRCGSGEHVVGLVVWNGNDVPQLDLFRHAVLPQFPEEGQVMAHLTGRAPVDCDLCGSTRLWDITPEALVEIFRHLDAGQVFEFSKKLLEIS